MKNYLKEHRLRIGLTQVQVAKKAGITERGYQRYEADEKSNQYSDERTYPTCYKHDCRCPSSGKRAIYRKV